MRRTFLLTLLLVAAFSSTGCISVFVEMFTDPMGRRASLKLAQREYTKFVRWGDIEAAAGFVHPELREGYLGYERELEGIRVTDFDVGEITYGEELKSAEVRVTYHAYYVKRLTEVEIKETQQWERLGKGNDWVVRPEMDGIIDRVVDFRL